VSPDAASAVDGSRTALEVREITVRFGGNVALDGVSISAQPGVVTGLIGPNGAGKTTLFNVITGLLPPSGGQVVMAGQNLSRVRPSSRARLGMARTFQRLELFTLLSVRENIRVAVDVRKTGGTDPAQFVDEIIGRIGLADVADARVDSLSTGRARLVELGRALATKPRVLLLDEPASGQDEHETEAFGRLLRELAQEGIAVLLVEHDMQLVMQVCDLIHVLDFGRIIAVGTAAEIQQDEAVLAAYLGTKS
jgi:branched-chain amino acid transport system ATP-binding protein